MISNYSIEEKEILEAFEAGKLKRIKRPKKEIIIAINAAANTIRKTKLISVHFKVNENSK